MPRLNWEIILYNIAEAREELERIETRAKDGPRPSEVELQIMLEHAYHHLNFAWNSRHVSSKRYRHPSDEEFNEWGKFPRELEALKINVSKSRKAKGHGRSGSKGTGGSGRAR